MRTSLRMSKNTILSFCLVAGSFMAFLLLNQAINSTVMHHRSRSAGKRGKTAKTAKTVKTAKTAKTAQSDEVFEFHQKKVRSGVPPDTTFLTSPFNCDNKRPLTATADSLGKPKVIAWQAGKTLRVMSTTSAMFQDCPVKTCEVSPDTNTLQNADAVVYDDGRMDKQTPPVLNSKRALVYYDMRTAHDIFFKAKGDLFSKYWKSAINWVWSYKPNADIFEPFAYLVKNPKPVRMGVLLDAVKKKSKTALWVNPMVDRQEDGVEDMDKNLHKGQSLTGVEKYLKEVKHGVSVDTMSMMDIQKMLNSSRSKKASTLSKYFFVLAFEWMNCKQYVTDLLFYAFDPRVQAVPVVRGGFNYTKHLPPGSFVDADAFPAAKDLSKHLKKLAADTKAYSQMLWNKSQYVREAGIKHAWCQLCDMLHRATHDKKLLRRYEDIHLWSRKSSRCQAPINVTVPDLV